MDQLTESTPNSVSSSSTRSILAIDLNQIPSPPETLTQTLTLTSPTSYPISPTTLVRSYHDNPSLPTAPSATIPASDPVCGGCGDRDGVDRLVCDGCERGFHVACGGGGGGGEFGEEWLCGQCLRDGVKSRGWRLGRTKEDVGFRLFDINVSPPRDADLLPNVADFRKARSHDNAYGGYGSSGVPSFPNSMYSENGFSFQKTSSIVKHTARLDFQDALHNSWSMGRSFEGAGHGSQLGRISSSSNTAFRLPSLNPGEVLQSLRVFVSERHGVLDEGWHVEFRQSKNGYETFAVYCAPDGKIFETMSDVACYLGLASSDRTVEPDLRSEDGSALRRSGVHVSKRRKVSKHIGNGFMDNKDLSGRLSNGFSSYSNGHFSVSKREKKSVVIETVQEEVPDTHQFHEGLPLQYEDFFVLSLGKVDSRASYHDTCQILPVGYKSCWHDKITGSLFLCHVLDGGDSGPVFKLKRFSCSTLPVPYASTILQRKSCCPSDVPKKKEGDKLTTSDDESCVEMILSDPSFPVEGDFLSWLSSARCEVDGQNISPSKVDSHSSVGDEIGEFSVDGNSSSLVWDLLSQKLAEACRRVYKQSGSLKFFCKHANEGISTYYDNVNDNNKDTFSSLHKFCSLLGSLKVPSVVKSVDDLDETVDALQYWLDSDRYGLDVDFVQELIEQCPDVKRCSRYESLKRRNSHLKAPLVQNGLLLINGRSIEKCQQDTVVQSLYKKYRNSQEFDRVIYSRPHGKPFGEKLPPYLIGDVLQVWGIISRFGEILSLEPLNFHELEAELLSPWFENLHLLGSCEKDSPNAQAVFADGQSLCGEQTLSSSGEIDQCENRFVPIQTAAVWEDSRAKINQPTHSKCTGLRKAHMALLDVIVSELQIKIAAMVDPSIDGESKARRGRRKDVDSSILAIRPKLNLLPINEWTWPELARRYSLAVLSMDGNLDSAENGMRECGKVFRCLQGDGGVLCGSLVGVAGIEADALLLAESTKQIYGCLISENDHLTIEDDDPETVSTSGIVCGGDGNIPAWAQVLEPVKKLPTNVGTRIRKCVYEALERDPPNWARKVLEHSISKEIYKGNASGPTKKAVLLVLRDVVSEASQHKPVVERKKKTTISVTDIIMRQCRILLRRAASADEEKLFCNLLGRDLTNTENDDEGLLGTSAMVSRPLDFRTIDLRLAVGVYRGSHEAFMEDVRELWKNISIAHADQPESVQLAETMSKNFEALYQHEVVPLVSKLEKYSKMEQMNPEAKRELLEAHASTSYIPKAPWDEGVCKVCGVDKNDDSVLLCDTCDAEYHTYCLEPPLARIPEGNWYCPSCVSGVSLLAATSKGANFIGRQRRRYHGDGIRNYLEGLARLSAVMQQKDYWEFSVAERISLLKFLCDEVLNSIVVRQHLEQCFETSTDLQQKLRTLYSEWKTIKLREDMLATKVAKLAPDISNVAGDSGLEGRVGKMANHSICEELQPVLSERSSNNSPALEANGANHLEKNFSFNSQVQQPRDLECQVEDFCQVAKEDTAPVDNQEFCERSSKRPKSCPLQESSAINSLLHEICGKDIESSCQGKVHERGELEVSTACKAEDEATVSCGLLNGESTEGVSCSTSNEKHSLCDELKAVQKELSVLQQSIASANAPLLKSLMRMEYLGTDSSGRLYWAYAQQGAHPWVIVDGTMALEPRKQGVGHASMMRHPWSGPDKQLSLEGSGAVCPFIYGSSCSYPTCSQWVYYQSEVEVGELVKSLNEHDPKERELKESIRNSQKLRFHELSLSGKQDLVPPEESMNSERTEVPSLLATKASSVLEGKYGPVSLVEALEVKKRGKRSRGTHDEKLYRCKCLEPVWHSRHHCFSCHRTFYTVDELRLHSDGKCHLNSSVSGKVKTNVELSGIPNGVKPDTQQHLVVATAEDLAHKSPVSKLSRLVEFQNKGLACPYKLDEIISKFVTNDSIKALVSEIGLIGSEGAPSFVPPVSSCPSDPTLMLQEDIPVPVDKIKTPEKAIGQSSRSTSKRWSDNVTDISARRSSRLKRESSESGQATPGILDSRKKFAPTTYALPMVVDAYCTVPESSLKPVGETAAHILRQLKICLLDMEAALPRGSLRLLKVDPEKKRAWHAFVKSADTIYEMIQATIVLEDMIKTDYLKNEWWYWSSLSAAVQTSSLSALALRIFALDNAIIYDIPESDLTRAGSLKSCDDIDQPSPSTLESFDKSKQGRRSSRRRKDADG